MDEERLDSIEWGRKEGKRTRVSLLRARVKVDKRRKARLKGKSEDAGKENPKSIDQ